MTKITRALISVSDKTGLVDLGKKLIEKNIEILSTGGSAKMLRDAGITVTEVGDYTGFPEMMNGRVKTLHPKIHGGLLFVRDSEEHKTQAKEHDIGAIDLVIVNLYPFRETVASGADFDECIENIDIGGPAMVRSAAKNHKSVTIITDSSQYKELLSQIDQNDGSTTIEFRKKLAAAAYSHTASYDSAISNWFSKELNQETPETLNISATLRQKLRYGENPHQSAAFYVTDTTTPSISSAIQVQGKELSYNNINDTDSAFNLISEFKDKPTIAIIKHANPCGVATDETLVDAYKRALSCDPSSAFGGIIACNRPLDGATASEITKIFSEIIIAPDMDDEAKEIVAKKKNLRVLLTKDMTDPTRKGNIVKSVSGGFLVQSRDNIILNKDQLKVVTKRKPSEQEMADMIFAFTVGKHVKSNTIIYAKDGATVGIGAGQMSRVDSAKIAASKAIDAAKAMGIEIPLTKNCAVASDAFFPFADGLLSAIDAGATAVIQPGGSIRDDEVIKAADDRNITMVFTGIRHFYH